MRSYSALVEEVKAALPVYIQILEPGATDEETKQFRKSIGCEIPDSLLQFYTVCSGSKPYTTFDIEGMCLNGLERILRNKEMFDKLLDEKNKEGEYFCWHKDWVPFADDYSYDTLAIDTTGTVTGLKGCILKRSKDMFEEDAMCIVARDFDTFIRDWAQRALEGQVYHVGQQDKEEKNLPNQEDHFEYECVKRVFLVKQEE